MASIQSSYTSPSKCGCSSPFRNLVSCSFLTSYFYSLNCLSCGDSSVVLPAFAPSIVSPMEMSSMLPLQFVWLPIPLLALLVPLLALQMVPLYPSSFFVPLLLCSHVPSSLVSLRLHLLQLCSSF